MDQENLGDLYSRLVTSSRLHQEMAGLLKFWLRGRRRFSSNIGPLSKVPFWCQVALTLIAGFAVTPANGYEVMMIVGGMSTLGGFSSYHRYCHFQFLIVPVICTSLWLFAHTVVPGFSVLGFRALSGFRALCIGNQIWIYVINFLDLVHSLDLKHLFMATDKVR